MPYVLGAVEEGITATLPPLPDLEAEPLPPEDTVKTTGQILGKVTVNGRTRDLTTDDYAWALRSVRAEAGGTAGHEWEWAAVLWTMANRWLGNYGRAGETFGQYIQRFSQPVNPNQIGKIHTYDRTADDPTGQRRSQERDARIRANRTRSVESITQQNPQLAAFVLKFFKGGVPREPFANFADFAAPYVQESAPVVGKGANVFYSEPWTTNLNVVMLGAQRLAAMASPAVIGAGLTLVAIGAVVGYYFWSKAQTVRA